MRDLNPEIPDQKILYQRLYQAMQGDIIGAIMHQYEGSDLERYIHGNMKSQSLQVLPNILPNLYELCESVKEALNFEEPVDFYITSSAEVNAYAILSSDVSKPHVIQIHSALFNLMSEDELKFIIGHEMGHLINKDGVLGNLYNFIYPDSEDEKEKAPLFLESRFQLWRRIAEFSADRYGYLACQNLEACVTAIFKLGSGLLIDKMEVRMSDLLDVNRQNLEYYRAERLSYGGTHPINPARIQALHLFVTAKTQKALNEGMETIMEVVEGFYFSDLDKLIATFFACAGYYMYKDRGKIGKLEEDFILNSMADYVFFPTKIYKSLSKEDYLGIMHQSMDSAIDMSPDCIDIFIRFLIDLAFVDNRIEENELNKIFFISDQLEINRDVMLKILTDKIREDFKPLASLMQ